MSAALIAAIDDAASACADLKQLLKERAMIYQCEAKEEAARRDGVPLDTYYYVPYRVWVAVRSGNYAAPGRPVKKGRL